MRRNHQRRLVFFLSGICALACAIAVPAVPQEATGVEPLPPSAEIPTPSLNDATASAAAEASPTASPSPLAPTAQSTAPGGAAPEGIVVTYDESNRITWYKPKIDPWKKVDFRIYPIIAKADSGARGIAVSIIMKDPYQARPTSLQVTTEEWSWTIPISESEAGTQDSGCRVTETIILQNRASLVQNLVDAARAEVAVVGDGDSVHYKMSPEDLANFRRMADLWSMPMLPPAPPKPAEDGLPAGAHVAGTGQIRDPEPIRKVEPKYPELARRNHVTGQVVLQAVIHKDGKVGELKVLRGAAGGDCGFEEAAMEAVRKWRYKPAMLDGQPVDVYFRVVVDFTNRTAPG